MGKCEICGEEGSRLQISHKDHGKIMVCRKCWKKTRKEGKKISEGTSSGGSSCSSCGACGI